MKIDFRFVARSAALIVVLTGAFTSSSQAASKGPSSAIMTAIATAYKAINIGSEPLWNAAHTSDAVILDNIAPYRWDGPNASAKWWASFGKWMQANNMTKPHIAYQTIQFWEQTGDRAYVVVPTTFTVLLDGKQLTQIGTLTLVLVRVNAAWKAQGWTWGTTSTK
jgi:hypothetical protein